GEGETQQSPVGHGVRGWPPSPLGNGVVLPGVSEPDPDPEPDPSWLPFAAPRSSVVPQAKARADRAVKISDEERRRVVSMIVRWGIADSVEAMRSVMKSVRAFNQCVGEGVAIIVRRMVPASPPTQTSPGAEPLMTPKPGPVGRV